LVHVLSRDGDLAWRRRDSAAHYRLLCDGYSLVIEQPPQAFAGLTTAPICRRSADLHGGLRQLPNATTGSTAK
jgi:hypothetical protein